MRPPCQSAGREVGEPGFKLAAGELLAQNDGAALVEADEVECVLADVDAEDGDGVFRVARHGPGSLLGSAPRSTLGYCGEHRRSIPLADGARTNLPWPHMLRLSANGFSKLSARSPRIRSR